MLGYASDPRLNDGTIIQAECMGDVMFVRVEPRPGRGLLVAQAPYEQVTVVFSGVETVEALHPERMMFSTLIHWDAPCLLRRFEFANWFQPGDDWDPWMSQARLEITARSYRVTNASPIDRLPDKLRTVEL
jgi:hypothetical protein